MLVACLLILAVTVGEISTASTQASNATTTSGAREARFNRNEKPLVLLRPIMGSHPGEKVLLSRQFAVNAPYSSNNHHPFPPMHIHPGQSGEFLIKRSPSPPGSGPPGFVLSAYPPQLNSEHLFQSQPPQSRPPQSPKPQLLRLQQQHGGPKSSPPQPPHPPQQYRFKSPASPSTAASSSSAYIIQQSSPVKNKPHTTILRAKPPTNNQYHGPPQTHSSSKPLKSSQKEFRASQPIPTFDQLDATRGSHLLSSDEHIYENLRSRSPSGSSTAHTTKFLTFTSGDNYLGDSSNENTWKPAVSSHSYPKHTTSAEIQQYQTQERISFYPDMHPEYFQTSGTGSKANVLSAIDASGSGGAAGTGKRKKLRRRLPSAPNSTDKPAIVYVNHNPSTTTTHNAQHNIRPIYEFQADDIRPSKRHDDPDFTADSHPDGNTYQSVSVSTSLQTTAGTGPAASPFDISSRDYDNISGGISLFVTPAKPDINDYDRSEATTSTTTARTAPTAGAHKSPTATRAPRLTPQQQRKLNNRVFRRKFVPPATADSVTCIGSCLDTIISHVNDPVCGSDDQTYENVGRLRCTKLCGNQHLHVVRFGNCENTDNQLN